MMMSCPRRKCGAAERGREDEHSFGWMAAVIYTDRHGRCGQGDEDGDDARNGNEIFPLYVVGYRLSSYLAI